MDNKGRKIIGFDMDGVLIDHTETKLLLAKRFRLQIKRIETPSDLIKPLIPQSIYLKFQFDLNDNPRFRHMSLLMPGAKEMLGKIIRSEVPYFLISRRKKPSIAIKILEYHDLWPKYFNKKNTFFVLTPEHKNIKAKELGITHYFDDQCSVLEKLIDVKNRFLFDHLDVFKNPLYQRIKSWKEIAKLI